MYQLSDYEYELPEALIAQEPLQSAHDACMLVVDRASGFLTDRHFFDLPEMVDPCTVIFFNNSKVIKARIPLSSVVFVDREGKEAVLGQGEIFVYRVVDQSHIEVLVSDGKHFRPGYQIRLGDFILKSEKFVTDGILMLVEGGDVRELLETHGQMPLPPYVAYEDKKSESYQTWWASIEGSVAAPTASLHFSPELVTRLQDKGVGIEYATLHIGLGTFKPLDRDDVTTYDIHREQVTVDSGLFERIMEYKDSGRPVLAVGTTMCRTLESLPYLWNTLRNQIDVSDSVRAWRDRLAQECTEEIIHNVIIHDTQIIFETQLYLFPGKKFHIIDQLITNFHLPRTTLLVLVSAFGGCELMKKAYEHALGKAYRFYSFGDGMWIK